MTTTFRNVFFVEERWMMREEEEEAATPNDDEKRSGFDAIRKRAISKEWWYSSSVFFCVTMIDFSQNERYGRYIHDVSMMFILNYKFCLSKNVYMLLVF